MIATSARVVSLVASGEGGKLAGNDGNRALVDIHERLQSGVARRGARRAVALVRTVSDVHWELKTAAETGAKQPSVVQIVGHGQPGVLLLEQYWTGEYQRGSGSLFCALDSNPHCYGALRDVVTSPTEVWLLGCDLGRAFEAGPGGTPRPVRSGPVLLFSLEQMWQTSVWASNGRIRGEHFDDDGVFRGPLVRFDGTLRAQGGEVEPASPRSARSGGVKIFKEFWPPSPRR